VQSEHRKYVREARPEEGRFAEWFFDVVADPEERTNLAEKPEEQAGLHRHRDYLDWVLVTFPPLQTRWAPLPDADGSPAQDSCPGRGSAL
jgi:hypothetical protein